MQKIIFCAIFLLFVIILCIFFLLISVATYKILHKIWCSLYEVKARLNLDVTYLYLSFQVTSKAVFLKAWPLPSHDNFRVTPLVRKLITHARPCSHNSCCSRGNNFQELHLLAITATYFIRLFRITFKVLFPFLPRKKRN